MKREFLGLASTLLLTSCGIFERHPESGYHPHLSTGMVKRSYVNSSSHEEFRQIETRTRLKQLENGIQTSKEVDQYSRALPYLRDENERIEFLTLPGFEARQRWLKEQDINQRVMQAREDYREIAEAQDIGVGMTQKSVKHAWGDPESVEVSGNPKFRNEQWRYKRYVATPDGYRLEHKSVYFEGGRVSAWENE